MAPITTTQTGTGRSTVILPDNFIAPFNVGLGAVVTGTATFNIEFSFDDPMDAGYVASSAQWYSVGGMYQLTETTVGNLTIPCKGVSINITSGTGGVTLTMRQAGTR